MKYSVRVGARTIEVVVDGERVLVVEPKRGRVVGEIRPGR